MVGFNCEVINFSFVLSEYVDEIVDQPADVAEDEGRVRQENLSDFSREHSELTVSLDKL